MTWKPIIVLLALGLAMLPTVAPRADEVGSAQPVVLSRQDGATMSIPRWKACVHPTDPNRIWLALANWGADGDQLIYSTNAGSSWQLPDIQFDPDYSLDYHLSVAGDASGNLHLVFPELTSVIYRRVTYPAQSTGDVGPSTTVRSFSSYGRANVMVQPDNQRVWVFTRLMDAPSENVRYHYTDDNGQTWTRGVADPTGHDNVRIGSMPYVDGRPALVVLYLNSSMGLRYYLWNGSAFEARPDAQIYSGNLGTQRAFAHNVINGEYMHVLFGDGTTLHHYWKAYNNGSGGWNHEIVDQSPYTSGNEWETTCSVRGNELFAIYSRKSSSVASSSQIYYAKWSQATEQWSSPQLVSNHPSNTDNHWPNTAMQVPQSADYIPVFWYSHISNNNEQVYFNRINLTVSGDVTPPAAIDDLGYVPGDDYGELQLEWTASGDDGLAGTAAYYELRRSDVFITEANWGSATEQPILTPPQPSGSSESLYIQGLDRGQKIYYAIRAVDEAGNRSDLAAATEAFAAGIAAPFPIVSEVDLDARTVTLTGSTVDSYHSLVYEFALDSETSFPSARTNVDLSAGSRSEAVFDQIEPGATYYWRVRALAADGTDSSAWSETAVCNSPAGLNDTFCGDYCNHDYGHIVAETPNPTVGSTTIFFVLPQRSHVSMEVFNLLGRRVATLADRSFGPGLHEVSWDGRTRSGSAASPGIYFFRMQTDDAVDSKKVLLVK